MTTTGSVALVRFTACKNSRPVHARQLEVGHDQIDLFLPQDVQAGFGVGGRQDGVALLRKVQLQQTPHLGFVFNNQESGHRSDMGC